MERDSGLALWGGSQGIQATPKLPIRRVSCSEEQTCLRVLAMLSDGLGAALGKYGPSRGVVVRAEQLGLSIRLPSTKRSKKCILVAITMLQKIKLWS